MRVIAAVAMVGVLATTPGCQLIAGFASTAADPALDAADSSPEGGGDAGPDASPPSGTHLWSRSLGHTGAVKSMRVATDESGNVYLAGSFAGAIELGGVELVSAGGDDIFVANYDSNGTPRWARAVGGGGDEAVAAIATGADGVFITGGFRGTTTLGGVSSTAVGGADILVASYRRGDGEHRWSKGFGGPGEDTTRGIVADGAGQIHLAGSFQQAIDPSGDGSAPLTAVGTTDVLLAGFRASDGEHLWSDGLGGPDGVAQGNAVAAANGAVYVTGRFAGAIDLGGGMRSSVGTDDAFVASYSGSDGSHRWSRALAGGPHASGTSIAASAAGAVFLAGDFTGTVDAGAGPLTSAGMSDVFLARYEDQGSTASPSWADRYGETGDDRAPLLALGADDMLFVSGRFSQSITFGATSVPGSGNADVFLARFDVDGASQWAQPISGSADDAAEGLAADSSGNVYLGGVFEQQLAVSNTHQLLGRGEKDAFVSSYRADSGYRWARGFGGGGNDSAQAVFVDASGSVFVTGSFGHVVDLGGGDLVSAGSVDGFLASYDGNRVHRSSRGLGGDHSDVAFSAVVDSGGNVTVSGAFHDSIDLGGGPLTADGAYDVFVVSFDPAGAHRWSIRFGGEKNDLFGRLAVDGDGNVTVVAGLVGEGDLHGKETIGSASGNAIFVASFTADGVFRWNRSLVTDGGYAAADGVATDASGNIYVAGHFNTTINAGGASLSSQSAEKDVLVASYDGANGAHRWSARYGGDGEDYSTSVAVGRGGDVFVTGAFTETVDFGGGEPLSAEAGGAVFIASYEGARGAYRWSRCGDGGGSSGRDIAVSAEGDVYVTGRFVNALDLGGGALTSAGGADIFVARYAGASGQHRWSAKYGSTGEDWGNGIAVSEREVLVCGVIHGAVDFGGGPRHGASRAGFLAAFAP